MTEVARRANPMTPFDVCPRCKLAPETLQHMLYECLANAAVADEAELVGDKVDGVVAIMLAAARMEPIKFMVLADSGNDAGKGVASTSPEMLPIWPSSPANLIDSENVDVLPAARSADSVVLCFS